MKGMILINNKKLLVAITCFNCEIQVQRVIEDIIRDKDLACRVDRFIFINNLSEDNTVTKITEKLAQAAELSCKSFVLKNEKNYGLGGSQKIAFDYCNKHQFDLLVVMHGDHQASFSDLKKIILEYEIFPKAAAILGSRFSLESKLVGYSKVRIVGNLFLNLLYSLLLRRRIFDLGSGLNLFQLQKIEIQKIEYFSDSFTFNADLLMHLISSKKDFKFVPITWTERDQKSNASNIPVGLNMLRSLIKHKMGHSDSYAALPAKSQRSYKALRFPFDS